MINIRRADERGTAKLDWLDSRHTFSFGHYFDPNFMGFGPLRVINDDRVSPGGGFATHGHEDMEIISYVLEGALEHKDSIGTGSVIRPGEIQRMSAGTGIRHSEFNHSKVEPVHFLQIWIEPGEIGIEPSYEQVAIPQAERQGQFRSIAGPKPGDGMVKIHQDVEVLSGVFGRNDESSFALQRGRKAWLHVATGQADLNGIALSEGDGASIEGEANLSISVSESAELLIFDLPA